MTFAIKTLGCKANQYESSVIASALTDAGLSPAQFGDKADIVIVNTCTVTDNSDRKCRNYIRQGGKFSQSGVIVAGCLPRRDSAGILGMEGVAGIIDTSQRTGLAKRILIAAGFTDRTGGSFDESKTLPFNHTRAFVRIQDGCAGKCSYCIVPSVRGAPVSRPCSEILSHTGNLVRAGVPEIVLTGITIGQYRDGETDIASLTNKISVLEWNFRIRITSIEPLDCTDAFIEQYRDNPRLCPHVHLPLQSGSDEILRRMNRPYTIARYYERVNKLRKAVPDISIGTDIITGFPGETDADFEETLRVCSDLSFSYVHTFGYSNRSGTVASEFRPCESKQISERSKAAREIGSALSKKYKSGFVGTSVLAVLEKDGKALTPHYLKVRTENRPSRNLAKVEISGIDESGNLYGKWSETVSEP